MICGGLISEWSIRRIQVRYQKMSDAELKDDARFLVSKSHQKALRWMRTQVRVKSSRDFEDEELEPLVQLWFDDYLFRDVNIDSHKYLLESLTKIKNQQTDQIVSAIGLLCTIIWLVSSIAIILLHFPAPSI